MVSALQSRHSHYMCVGMRWVFLYMCGVHTHMYASVCRGPKSRSGVITWWFPACALRQGLSLNRKLINLTSLAGRWTSGILLPPTPTVAKVGLPAYTAMSGFCIYGFWGGVLMIAAGTSPTEPSPEPQYKVFLSCFRFFHKCLVMFLCSFLVTWILRG